jgi:hypothetical protein
MGCEGWERMVGEATRPRMVILQLCGYGARVSEGEGMGV